METVLCIPDGRQDGTKRYYYDSEGRLAQGAKKIGSYWYYFNGNGTMYTGWRASGSQTYYYNSDGHLAIGTATIDGKDIIFSPMVQCLQMLLRITDTMAPMV